MKIKPLGCYGGQLPGKNNTAFLVNGDTLIDAGTIALNSDIKTQRGIKTVFLSHAHLDHTGGLPFFAVNIVSNKSHGVNIIGPGPTISAVKKHLMNGVTWPDFTKIKNFGGRPVFSYTGISAGKWHKIGKYRIKIIPVKHTIPTWGYIIGQGSKYCRNSLSEQASVPRGCQRASCSRHAGKITEKARRVKAQGVRVSYQAGV